MALIVCADLIRVEYRCFGRDGGNLSSGRAGGGKSLGGSGSLREVVLENRGMFLALMGLSELLKELLSFF